LKKGLGTGFRPAVWGKKQAKKRERFPTFFLGDGYHDVGKSPGAIR